MMRFELDSKYKRLARVTMEWVRASLPRPAALRRAAVEHLVKRGRVRYPMRPGRPEPEPRLKASLSPTAGDRLRGRRRAALGKRWKLTASHPAEIVLNVGYQVPVNIETPWGPVVETVRLARSYDGNSWTCSSAPVDRRSLEALARAERYPFLLFVVPDASAARAVARRGTSEGRALDRRSLDIADWNTFVGDFRDSRLFWSSGREGRSSAEFRRFVRVWTSRRQIVSHRPIALTAKQQRAFARLRPWFLASA